MLAFPLALSARCSVDPDMTSRGLPLSRGRLSPCHSVKGWRPKDVWRPRLPLSPHWSFSPIHLGRMFCVSCFSPKRWASPLPVAAHPCTYIHMYGVHARGGYRMCQPLSVRCLLFPGPLLSTLGFACQAVDWTWLAIPSTLVSAHPLPPKAAVLGAERQGAVLAS